MAIPFVPSTRDDVVEKNLFVQLLSQCHAPTGASVDLIPATSFPESVDAVGVSDDVVIAHQQFEGDGVFDDFVERSGGLRDVR